MNWPQVSKKVGWDHLDIDYPNILEVTDAYNKKDIVKMLRWHRFLKSPVDDYQAKVIQLIFEYLIIMKKELENANS